jgi:hypothetical protein
LLPLVPGAVEIQEPGEDDRVGDEDRDDEAAASLVHGANPVVL